MHSRTCPLRLEAEIQIEVIPGVRCRPLSRPTRTLSRFVLRFVSCTFATIQLGTDWRKRPVFMLRLGKMVGVRAVGGINRLIEQVRKKIVLKPRFMRPYLRFDIGPVFRPLAAAPFHRAIPGDRYPVPRDGEVTAAGHASARPYRTAGRHSCA